MSALFTARDVSKGFDVKGRRLQALKGLSLSVEAGGFTALVGPDGAGKTTMLRIAAGLLAPEKGELLFEGQPLKPERTEAQQDAIGYMPQKFGLYEDLSVQENLDLYADLKGVGMKEREERYRRLLSMAGLSDFRERLAGKLSGGMKQKLGLICTLVAPPKLLILDEPTVGVDPLSRRELWEIVEELTGESGMGVLVSTSYLDEAQRCDAAVLLSQGETIAAGKPADIMRLTEGMSFLAESTPGVPPRALQAKLLDLPFIIDALPQGGAVRLVHGALSAEQKKALSAALSGAPEKSVPPTLEDSFIRLLKERDSAKESALPSLAQKAAEAPAPKAPDPNEPPVIETKHVSRYFGSFAAVDDVSFSVSRGEVFGLLGPNGAGKTTTFRMLCGLLPASRGSLFVAGVDVRRASREARRRVGYVAQRFSLYGQLTVLENLEFFAGAYGLPRARRKERIEAVAEDFALTDKLDMTAGNLPGGWQRRLAMAAGLIHEPEILFLDEPTSGADPLARRSFWKLIAELSARGVTTVVTTHFMEEAEYCDRILIQAAGKMLALGTPAEIRALGTAPGGRPGTMEDAFIAIVESARKEKKS